MQTKVTEIRIHGELAAFNGMEAWPGRSVVRLATVLAELEAARRCGPGLVFLDIDCLGGHPVAGFALYDALRRHAEEGGVSVAFVRRAGSAGVKVVLGAGAFAALWAKAVLSELFVGHGPKKDDDRGEVEAGDWASWAAWKGVTFMPSTIPFAGAAVRQLEQGQGRDMSLTPWIQVGNAAVRAVAATNKSVAQLVDGEELGDDQAAALFWAWLEAGGSAVGAPTVQARATGKALQAWASGDVVPRNPVEAALRIAYGNKRDGGLPDAVFGAP